MRKLKVILGLSVILFMGWNFYTASHTTMVSGVSMSPTYQDEQIISISSDVSHIKKNDVVIIRRGKNNYIKRVIATPGDVIDIKGDKIYLNGSYSEEMGGISDNVTDMQEYPLKLHDKQYFVMGDNRIDSWDSRSKSFGIVKENEIIAIAEHRDKKVENPQE
jgi:signal peptidase I